MQTGARPQGSLGLGIRGRNRMGGSQARAGNPKGPALNKNSPRPKTYCAPGPLCNSPVHLFTWKRHSGFPVSLAQNPFPFEGILD